MNSLNVPAPDGFDFENSMFDLDLSFVTDEIPSVQLETSKDGWGESKFSLAISTDTWYQTYLVVKLLCMVAPRSSVNVDPSHNGSVVVEFFLDYDDFGHSGSITLEVKNGMVHAVPSAMKGSGSVPGEVFTSDLSDLEEMARAWKVACEDDSDGWTLLGGDIEGRFDGNRYVDIRLVGREDPVLFLSKEALENAVKLFPSK